MRQLRQIGFGLLTIVMTALPAVSQVDTMQTVRIKDITTISGVRDNPLIGYGLVVGLNGTGDRRQTVFSTQTLFNVLQRMGIQIPAEAVRVNNIAAVMVTATLPPSARPGMKIDVTVSSIGDAESLEGGLLLLTPLSGADGQIYAAAQGPMVLGGYSAGGGGQVQQVNHPTVGRVPAGAIVEAQIPSAIDPATDVTLVLREHDYSTSSGVANTINSSLGSDVSRAIDGRTIRIALGGAAGTDMTQLLARIENLEVTVERPAKVVINERTGTVVMGSDVRLGAVSILHGNLTIDIATQLVVSQPNSFRSGGETVVVPQVDLAVSQGPAERVELPMGATVEDLVLGLQGIGATARDIVAILQAVKAANALQAELEII